MYKIELDDETKLNISAVLRYYRGYLKIKQSDFIRYNDASVCSADTYSRIENGKIIKRSSIYVYLLYQIQASIDYTPSFWKQQLPTFHHLLSALLQYRMDEYKRLCIEFQKTIKDSNDYLARELYELLEVSLVFYDEELALNTYHYQKFSQICRIFPLPIQVLVKDMLFQTTFRYERNLSQCQTLFHQLHMEDATHPLLMIDTCREALFEGRYLESHAIALSLEQRFLKDKNYPRLLDVYEVILLLYRKLQPQFRPTSYLDKFFDLIHEHGGNFHHAKYLQGLYINALLQYHEQHFDDAYDCFLQLAHGNVQHFLPSALFVNIIADKTNDPERKLLPPLPKEQCFPSHLVAFYQYYIHKNNHWSADELEAYLVRNVLPYITSSDMIYWEPLRDELQNLIKETKHYYIKKKLYEECL